ncbi:MAG: response regulator [Gammaproteobacteria bacterium]|nr:response regulator [Gammaproteobacteria bacterium]NNL51909.1 response regulator [Woeseiaceae bacterium]
MRLPRGTLLAAIAVLLAGATAVAAVPIPDLTEPVSVAGDWKFRLGDERSWATPELDDSAWELTAVPAHSPQGQAGFSGMLWYRLALNLDLSEDSVRDNVGALGVRLGKVMSAYELYAGGIKIGHVGRLPPEAISSYDQHAVFSIPRSSIDEDGRLTLALRVWRDPQVSPAWETGPYHAEFLIGNVGKLQNQLVREAFWPNAILAAVYLVLGLYHFLIARRNTGLREFFWFGLFSVVLAGYTFETSQAKFFVDAPYMWHKKLEFLLLYAAPILFGNTLFAVTRTPINRIIKSFYLLFGLFFFSALLSPGDVLLSHTLRWFQYLVALWALIMAGMMARRAHEGSRPARVVVALLLLMVAALFNDYLLESAIIGSGNILYIVFALMLFFVALMMAERYTDILRNLEGSVAKRTSELVEANRELEAAVATKGNFLANMSHEMRTPMNAILGLTHLGLKTDLNDQQRDYFDKVERSAADLQHIIDSILDFSKLEDGSLECINEPFSPASLLDGVKRTWQESISEAGLELVIEADPDAPETLVGDEKRLRQVLGNFISNAVKYTEEGRIVVSMKLLDFCDGQARIRFAVTDTGIGIEKDKQRQLFDAFSQGDNTTTRQYGGTGLGLAIAQRLVELMGGNIGIDSTPGSGSSFSFELALSTTDHDVPERPDVQELDLTPIRGARVLLVDDSELNLQVAGELLRQARLHVDTALNGKEAVEKVGLAHYDCVLMDVQMPVMDGYTATERIRAKPHFKELPILAMTANAMPQDRARGEEAGMNTTIPKPIDPNELNRALLRWIPHGGRTLIEEPSPPADPGKHSTIGLPKDLPGINVAEGLQRVAGNELLYLNLLKDFSNDYADAPSRLQALVASGESDEARQLAHKLRGIANNLGAGDTGEAAEIVELALKSGTAVTPDALRNLTDALAVAQESQSSLEPLMATDAGSADMDEADRRALYLEAVQAVSANDPAALTAIENLLAGMTEDMGGYAELNAAREALDIYDFGAAGEHLEAAAQPGQFAE